LLGPSRAKLVPPRFLYAGYGPARYLLGSLLIQTTLSRVLTDYRCSMLHERLLALVLLAFEKDITLSHNLRQSL